MSQKFIKKVNTNPRSMAYGKCFARAIYDKTFVGTKQLADFIQTQASVKIMRFFMRFFVISKFLRTFLTH